MNGRLIVSATLISATLASCGGDSGSESAKAKRGASPASPTSAAPTKAEFISEVDALCLSQNGRVKRENERIQTMAKRAPDDQAVMAGLEPILRKGVEYQRAKDREFERLRPPRSDADQFQKMTDYNRDLTALLSRITEAADRQDGEAFQALTAEQKRLTERARGYFQGYGFKECGSGKGDAD
ncbi:MAG: hypothetical protein ACR2FZ_07445 [Thermoleophilaceae bacterium]